MRIPSHLTSIFTSNHHTTPHTPLPLHSTPLLPRMQDDAAESYGVSRGVHSPVLNLHDIYVYINHFIIVLLTILHYMSILGFHLLCPSSILHVLLRTQSIVMCLIISFYRNLQCSNERSTSVTLNKSNRPPIPRKLSDENIKMIDVD